MMGYFSYFKIRFIYGLQYRAAALAGIVTQFAWGFMYIMIYETFYQTNPKAAPMGFSSAFQLYLASAGISGIVYDLVFGQ